MWLLYINSHMSPMEVENNDRSNAALRMSRAALRPELVPTNACTIVIRVEPGMLFYVHLT